MMLKNKFLFCTILIILGIMFFGGSSCSAYTKKIPASSVYYETSTTKYCDPTDFYAMTDWGSSRDNRTGEMAFNLNSIPSEVTIISAKICAYTNFNFGAPFMNYIEKLVQVTCSTSPWGTEVPYWNIGSATITADYGWKCINITPSEVTKAGNFYIRWWGNDQNEQQTGFVRYSGTNSTLSRCVSNPSGASNCGPYIDITYEVPVDSYNLILIKNGTGTGYVSAVPSGISCGTNCSQIYDDGISVTLYATAYSGSTFAGWSGSCSGTSSSCTVAMTSAKNVTATFNTNIVTYGLSVSKIGTGSGTISSSPSGISCGTDCYQAYNSGTSVTLYASAASGSNFAGWGGSCSGISSSCIVSMIGTKSAIATFSVSADYYRVYKGQTTRIMEHNICRNVKNNSTTNDVFVPTKTLSEWTSLHNWTPNHIYLTSCTSACTNDCSYSGQTETQCSGNYTQKRTCGYYDSDTCLDWSSWSNVTNCDASDGCSGTTYRDYYCSGGGCTYTDLYNDSRCVAACTNDCSYLGQTATQCSGNWIQSRTCENNDTDTCLDWSSWSNETNCDASDGCSGTTYRDYYCSGGSCTYTNLANDSRCVAACTNECSSGSIGTQCSGSYIQSRTCGYYDSDTCLDWSSWSNVTNCDSSDGCIGTTYRDYYCSGTTCNYNDISNSSECGVTCRGACALTGPDAGRCDAECGASSQCDGVAAHTSWSSGSTCYACGFCSPDDCAAGASDNCALTTDPDKEPTYEAIGDICYYNCSNYCVSDEFTARAEWRWAPINQTSYACSQDSDKACDDATCSSTGWNNIACQYTTTKYIRADAVLGRYVSGTHYCNSGDTRISGRCIPDNASDKTEYTTSAYPNGWTCDFSCDTWLCRADGDIELVCE